MVIPVIFESFGLFVLSSGGRQNSRGACPREGRVRGSSPTLKFQTRSYNKNTFILTS